MGIVADTNVFLAVAMNAPPKKWLVNATKNSDLAAPAVLPYEIANALSALVRRKRIEETEALSIWNAAANIPVELTPVDIAAALSLATHFSLYAYDAFFLQCAVERRQPLLSLDERMKRIALKLGLDVMERR